MAKKKVMTFSWNHFMERLRNSVFRPKRQVKDIVFRLIFGNNKEALLQLYNALNKTKYTNPNELRIVTLDNAIYISMKNDLAFLLVGTINMYEHQSTVNPNMPVRFMIYLAQEYQMLVGSASSSLQSGCGACCGGYCPCGKHQLRTQFISHAGVRTDVTVCRVCRDYQGICHSI